MCFSGTTRATQSVPLSQFHSPLTNVRDDEYGGDETRRGRLLLDVVGIKRAVRIPVAVAGGLSTADHADRIVRDGDADVVCVGRAMLDDPAWTAGAIAALQTRGDGCT